ncbi:MAG: hypothetical protein ABFD89_05350 [Bryobacteraceae bacterium]
MNLESALSKTREIIRLRHLSLSTEDTYVAWITRYSRFISERCHEANVQRAVKSAAVPLGLDITPLSAFNFQHFRFPNAPL